MGSILQLKSTFNIDDDDDNGRGDYLVFFEFSQWELNVECISCLLNIWRTGILVDPQ